MKLDTLSPLPKADFKRKFGAAFDLEMSPAELLQHAKFEKWFREGDGNTLLKEVPYRCRRQQSPSWSCAGLCTSPGRVPLAPVINLVARVA